MSDIPYTLRVSPRAKNVRITIHPDGSVVVTIPRAPTLRHYGFARRSLTKEGDAKIIAERFVARKAKWIAGKLAYFEKLRKAPGAGILPKSLPGDYERYKEAARRLAERRIEYFNETYQFSFKRISIRNQKTRWGSCSRKGNLNFNYKIALLPDRLADYIIVHELCHLAEFNHSRKFWNLVAKAIPDHAASRRELKASSLVL
jgi:predicted metal-dependent hydrolase